MRSEVTLGATLGSSHLSVAGRQVLSTSQNSSPREQHSAGVATHSVVLGQRNSPPGQGWHR